MVALIIPRVYQAREAGKEASTPYSGVIVTSTCIRKQNTSIYTLHMYRIVGIFGGVKFCGGCFGCITVIISEFNFRGRWPTVNTAKISPHDKYPLHSTCICFNWPCVQGFRHTHSDHGTWEAPEILWARARGGVRHVIFARVCYNWHVAKLFAKL